jgi:hypothetical protein
MAGRKVRCARGRSDTSERVNEVKAAICAGIETRIIKAKQCVAKVVADSTPIRAGSRNFPRGTSARRAPIGSRTGPI